MTLALGLMSGTSCDGMSAALAEFSGRRARLVRFQTTSYPASLSQLLRRARELTVPAAAQLNVLLGELSAQAALGLLRAARVRPGEVAVIGSHGHTMYHGPGDPIPCTLQLGEPSIIAQRTGIPVVADFRMGDLASGGQGAPLIPFFDHYFFGGGAARALQNIGGIANVTFVGRGLTPVAFDTGPGNCLIDAAARHLTRGAQRYDRGGRLARSGRIDERAAQRLWALPYFRRWPPKSTGPELFNESLFPQTFGPSWRRRLPDVLATVTYFTAYSIAHSYHALLPGQPREVIVSGGGALNATLMRHLAMLLAPIPVCSIADYGLAPQAKEPVAFAFLALRALRRQPNHLPGTTGAHTACILGKMVFRLGRRPIADAVDHRSVTAAATAPAVIR